MSNATQGASSPCPSVLLSDYPAREDVFGGHDRVARSLLRLIRSHSSSRAIGLEGAWGSGKSTVIRILEEQAANDPDLCVISFDTWAHEGDHLRRAFLQDVTSKLGAKNWVPVDLWTNELEKVTTHTTGTTERTKPVLSPVGKTLAVSAILAPLGLLMVERALDGDVSLLPTGAGINWLFTIGLLLATGPFTLPLGFGAYVARKRGQSLDEHLVLTSGTQPTVTTTLVQADPEPSSLEFADYFSRLMSTALGTQRRIILVIDNLDRVTATSALGLWATLQPFVTGNEGKDWAQRTWLVVPHDKRGLRSHLQEETVPVSATSVTDPYIAFAEKSFQVQLRVPEPLVSDKRRYLEECLQQALPEHPQSDIVDCAGAIYHASNGTPFSTPREAKHIVNRVAAIHEAWQHQVPLPVIGFFASANGVQPDQILDPAFADRVLEYPSFSRDTPLHLAVLHFNATEERARQLLLSDKIRGILAEGDGDSLGRLGAENEWFHEAIYQECLAFLNDNADTEPARLVALAHAASVARTANGLRPYQAEDLIRRARARLAKASSLRPLAALNPLWVKDLVSGESSLDADHLLVGLNAALGEEGPPTEQLSKHVLEVVGILFDRLPPDAAKARIQWPGSLEDYFAAVKLETKLDTVSIPRGALVPLADDADEVLKAVSQVPASYPKTAAFAHMLAAGRADGTKVAQAALGRLLANVTPDVEVGPLVHLVLFSIAAGSEAGFSSFWSNGASANVVANSRGIPEALAPLLMAYLDAFEGSHGGIPQVQALWQQILTGADEKLVDRVAFEVDYWSERPYAAALLQLSPEAFARIVQRLATAHAVPSTFPAKALIDAWPQLQGTFDTSTLEADQRFCARVGEELASRPFNLAWCRLYVSVIGSASSNVCRQLADGLLALTREEWLEELDAGCLPSLVERLPTAKGKLGPALREAIFERLISGVEPELTWSMEVALEQDQRSVLRDDLVGRILDSPGEVDDSLFAVAGQALLSHIDDKGTSAYRALTLLIEAGSPAGVSWAIKALNERRLLITRADGSRRKSLRKAVERRLSDLGDDDRLLADGLIKKLGR